MNVSYVNFDKTKPYVQKQIGDGLPHSSTKTLPQTTSKLGNVGKEMLKRTSNNHNQVANGKSNTVKNTDSDTSMIFKNKSMKLNKNLDMNTKQQDVNQRPNKKHKKDLV